MRSVPILSVHHVGDAVQVRQRRSHGQGIGRHPQYIGAQQVKARAAVTLQPAAEYLESSRVALSFGLLGRTAHAGSLPPLTAMSGRGLTFVKTFAQSSVT